MHPAMTRLSLLPLLALAACGTPQERCINSVTKDLRTLTGLIGETQGNIARGFGYQEYEVTRTRWVQCRDAVRNKDGSVSYTYHMCLDDYTTTVRKPVAIDLTAEKAKLVSMQAKQKQLNTQAAKQIAVCKQQHPE